VIDQIRRGMPFLLFILLDFHLAGCAGENSDGQGPGEVKAHSKTVSVSCNPAPQDRPARPKAPAAKAVTKEITIDNFTYNPSKLTVPVGTKVTWINQDDVPHTVTSSAKPRRFKSGTLDTDDRFSYVFTAPGTYKYFCAVHPHMTAQIIVK
jgi:plastocyanin